MSGITVVYLGGFGRSGSTLVERVLGAVPGWVNVGELVDLARSVAPADELCGCGVAFSACPLWTEVGEVAFGGWTPEVLDRLTRLQRAVARQRHLPGLLRGRATSGPLTEFRADYARIYRAVAEVSGAQVIVDASKGPAFGLALAGAPGVDLRMLNVVRDPRAVAWSWQRHVERPQTTGAVEEMWRIPAHRSGAQWSALQLEMTAIAAWGGVPFARLRYEDFVTDPVESLVTATGSLGLALTATDLPTVDGGRLELGPSHGLSGNPGRFRSGTIELRRDDGWTAQMRATDRAVVTALTVPLLRAYGYPTVAGAAAASDKTRSTRHEEHHVTEPGPATEDSTAGAAPLVTVVIPTRGRPALLLETLAAIVGQDYAGPLEVFVVHDREEADESLADLSRPGRRIVPMVNTRTGGLCGARNTGVLLSRADFVASCDDDDLWYPAKVRLQVERLLADPDLLAVGAGIRLLMGERGDVEWPARQPIVTHGRLLENRVKELHSSTLMMRRSAFDVAGLYDEELPFGHGEDYDWLLRASRAGSVGAVQEILADIRKDVPSWFRDRWLNTATALEYILEKHPDFRERRRGHARMLGQIAYARAAAGERARGARLAGRALSRYPATPHAWLALAVAGPGIEPRRMLSLSRRLGRGLS